jgi:hypothetical protein
MTGPTLKLTSLVNELPNGIVLECDGMLKGERVSCYNHETRCVLRGRIILIACGIRYLGI